MKSMLLSGVLAVALMGTAAVWAADDHKGHGKHDQKEEKKDSSTTKPVNKMCAVQQDNPVDNRVTIQHEGKTIGFCCEDCIPEFKKDPEKYTKNMK